VSHQTVDSHHKQEHVFKVKVQNNKYYAHFGWKHDIFTWKPKSKKNTTRRRKKFHYNSSVYMNYKFV